MRVVAEYDFNGGASAIAAKYSSELNIVKSVIASVDSSVCKTKVSKEKTMPGRVLYSPAQINKAFKAEFAKYGWRSHKVICEYVQGQMAADYTPPKVSRSKPFRDMDFIVDGKKLGIEVQFGKYAFMVYNVCAKMTIFSNLGVIDTGIEIVPVKNFADEMSTGVSYFEQFAWDLEKRGMANIDIPVLILGIDA
jgi:hypothetical protein